MADVKPTSEDEKALTDNEPDGPSTHWFPPLRWWRNQAPVVQFALIAIGGVFGLIFLIFIIGFLLAIFGDPLPTADRLSSIRDILFIIAIFLLVCIVIAATALVLQLARLAETLRGEIRPMLDNTREATETVRGTARFVGKNVTEPIITGSAMLAGVLVFLRELGGIRRAIRKRPDQTNETSEE